MRRHSKKVAQQAAAANNADTNTVEAGATDAPAIDTSDDAVDAALAAIEASIEAEAVELGNVEIVDINVEATDDGADMTITAHVGGDSDDAEIEALLAEDTPLTATDATAETVADVAENLEAVTEDDVKDVIQNDADALLAELDADDAQTAAPVAAAKPSRKKKDPSAAPATAPTPKRDFHSIASIDASTLKANLDGNKAQKVAEKAQNLIQAIETGKKLSRYTSVAVRRMVEDGKVSGKSLVEAFQGEGLSIGTARAQAQQMTALFRIAGIAQPDASAPKELVLADRGLADELVRLAA